MRRLIAAPLLLLPALVAHAQQELPPLVGPDLLDIAPSPYEPDATSVPNGPDGEPGEADAGPYGPIPDSLATATSEPELEPPAIDAWIDASFSDSAMQLAGVSDDVGGYRFVASFLLEKLAANGLAFSPEVGYSRIGRGEDVNTTAVSRPPGFPNHAQTRTDTLTADITSLDFGVRAGWRGRQPLEPFARAGLSFYHLASSRQVVFTYETLDPDFEDISPDTRPTSSSTDAGVAPYLSIGLALHLGKVPAVYAEFQYRSIEGEPLETAAVGFLLNF